MLWLCFLALFSSVEYQAPMPGEGNNCLLPAERERLQREPKLDNRIKIYDEANKRCEAELTKLVQGGETQPVSNLLKQWISLLESSKKDIDESKTRKDKSKALIRYEIHLRKSISTVQEAKLKSQVEQLEEFESWLTRAEKVHSAFVAALFPK